MVMFVYLTFFVWFDFKDGGKVMNSSTCTLVIFLKDFMTKMLFGHKAILDSSCLSVHMCVVFEKFSPCICFNRHECYTH